MNTMSLQLGQVSAATTVTMPCNFGLHMRVAVQIITAARRYRARLLICHGRSCVDSQSICGVMSLGVRKGQRVLIKAEGPEANKAIQGLKSLFSDVKALCPEVNASGA